MNCDELYSEILRRCNLNPEDFIHDNEVLVTDRFGTNVNFERIRRITGYLVGDTSRWNNGKKAELNERTTNDDS